MTIASLEIYTACYNCGAMVHRDYIACGGCPYCGFPIITTTEQPAKRTSQMIDDPKHYGPNGLMQLYYCNEDSESYIERCGGMAEMERRHLDNFMHTLRSTIEKHGLKKWTKTNPDGSVDFGFIVVWLDPDKIEVPK